MKLVIIIPALNEQLSIASVIHHIPKKFDGLDDIEVVVIDDGSGDRTVELARTAGATVVQHAHTMGVGAAFHTGIKEALVRGADIIVNIDADGQFDPTDISKLLQPILHNRAGFVTATRFARPDLIPDMPAIKKWGNRWMTRIINFLTHQHFTDVSCGFRAYARETALKLTLFGHFTYTQESFIDLAYKNVDMMEVPLRVRGERQHGHSRVASNLWRYGSKSASIIFRTARDYQPLYFFGLPGLIIFVAGVIIGLALLIFWLHTGHTSPYKNAVALSTVLIVVGIFLIFLSMLADMMHRNRMVAEEAVYLARKKAYGPPRP